MSRPITAQLTGCSWPDRLKTELTGCSRQLSWHLAAELTVESTSGSWADKMHLSRHVAAELTDCSWADTMQLRWADILQPSWHNTAELTYWADRLQPSWQIMTEWLSTDNVDIVSDSTTTPSSKCLYIKHPVVLALMLWTWLVCFSAHQWQGVSTCMLTLWCITYVLLADPAPWGNNLHSICGNDQSQQHGHQNHSHRGKLDTVLLCEN